MRILFIAILSLVFTIALYGQNPAIENFFDQYIDDDRFTQVNISPKMFQMFAQMEEGIEMDQDIKEMIAAGGYEPVWKDWDISYDV